MKTHFEKSRERLEYLEKHSHKISNKGVERMLFAVLREIIEVIDTTLLGTTEEDTTKREEVV